MCPDTRWEVFDPSLLQALGDLGQAVVAVDRECDALSVGCGSELDVPPLGITEQREEVTLRGKSVSDRSLFFGITYSEDNDSSRR